MMMIEPSEAGELIRSGKLRAIAQIADQRIEGFPDVPTIKEAGFNIPNVPQSRGMVGPPDMPAAAVAYYDDLFKRACCSLAAYREYLKSTQLENVYLESCRARKIPEVLPGPATRHSQGRGRQSRPLTKISRASGLARPPPSHARRHVGKSLLWAIPRNTTGPMI